MEPLSTDEIEAAAGAALTILRARCPALQSDDEIGFRLAFQLGFADGAMFMVQRMKEMTK